LLRSVFVSLCEDSLSWSYGERHSVILEMVSDVDEKILCLNCNSSRVSQLMTKNLSYEK
jgi:hypothetical protein